MVIVPLEMIPIKRLMWGNMHPTPGAFLICTVMSGNGFMIGMQLILVAPKPILPDRLRARLGSYGVVPGTSTGRTCVRLGASATPRASAAAPLASVSVSKSSSQRREEGVIRLAYFLPWSDRVDCRVVFQGNPFRNHKALDGRMTDRLISKWRSAAGLAKRGVSPKGPCQQARPSLTRTAK